MQAQTESLPLTVDGLTPRRVEAPPDAASIAAVLKQSAGEQCAVVPLGGGTMLDLGTPLARADLVISLQRLNRILDHQPANLTVKVETGITLGALNQALAEHGQTLPLDPPFPDRATIGGILATNASGPLRLRFGAPRDLTIGLRVALPDGLIAHGGGDVVKNVAGYDLPKLFVGSLGTLGIITEASFKIVPLPPRTATLVARFDTLDAASQLALQVLHSPLFPYAVEMVNAAAAASLGLGDCGAAILRFGGLASTVGQALGDAEKWARQQGAVQVDVLDPDADVWTRLRDFIYEKEIVCKVSALPTQLSALAAEAERIAEAHGLTVFLFAHALGVLYVAFHGNFEQMLPAIGETRDSVTAQGGHLVVQRAPRPLRKQMDVWGPTRSDFIVMQRLKKEFDPNGILNPGRFIGGI